MENDKKYGLFTAIAMITGIVIGSGIFFKSDDVLTYTHGNILLGILVFLIAAIAIIFGSLSISQLAMRTDKPGGIISYAEEFVNEETASAFGWFQVFLYLPSTIAVVAWVAGIYICQLFGIAGDTALNPYTIGLAVIIFIFGINIMSAKFGGIFQNVAMIIKLIPLILFIILGMLKGDPSASILIDFQKVKETGVDMGILAAFAPIAFSFDGWIIATSICHEIKNSKRNLPIAMIVSPIVILLLYVLYFVGVSVFLGPDRVVELGNASVDEMAKELFGPSGAKVVLIFIIISVLGTANGVSLALTRMPYSLAIRKMIPGSSVLSKQNEQKSMPYNSAIFALIITLLWYAVHYITSSRDMMNGGDVSEIAICISYLNYVVLYCVIIRLARKGEITSKVKGYFIPIMAIIGSAIILLGGFSNPMFKYYLIICLIVMIIGYFYFKKVKNS